MDWHPAGYCAYYGQQWCTPPYDGPPHYPDVPTIWVVDLAAKRLKRKRREFWRKARDMALQDWEASGLRLSVFESPTLADGYQPGKVTLDCTVTHDGTAGQAAFGLAPISEDPLPGVGWAHVSDTSFDGWYQARTWGSARAVIGHEVGHTFGFGHNPGPGCMDINTTTNARVSAEETEALHDYFLGG